MPSGNPHLLKPFKKGKDDRRNMDGYPKGRPNRSTIARKWLEAGEKFKNPITGKEEHLTQEDIITLGQIKEARKGNTLAYKALMDSAHGAPKQEVDLTSLGESIAPIQVVAVSPEAV